jgi:flagellar motor switch protein FliN/FliY
MMIDENDTPEDDEGMSQDAIDELLGDESSGGMNFDEIDDSGIFDDEEQEFDIGEPMAGDVTAIYDIPVQISAVLGKSTMQVSQLLKLGRGAVVELDRKP